MCEQHLKLSIIYRADENQPQESQREVKVLSGFDAPAGHP